MATIRQDLVGGIEALVIRGVEANREVISQRAVAVVGDRHSEASSEVSVKRNLNTTKQTEVDRDVVVMAVTGLAFDSAACLLALARHVGLRVLAVGR